MAKKKDDDPQAKIIYAWEREFFDWNRNSLSLKEMRTVVHGACDRFGVPYPASIERQSKRKSYSSQNKYGLRFSKESRHFNIATALHESAHHISRGMFGRTIQTHGPEYLGVYVDLLLTFKIAPKDAVLPSLKSRGLKYITHLPHLKKKAGKR